MNKDEIKIQAYRDFADKLKVCKRAVKGYDFNGEFWYYVVFTADIENILLEMVNEND